jgi:AraC-like DNA-binding protein
MTKPKRPYSTHLTVEETTLPPGCEWIPQFSEWVCLHISAGIGYWLHSRVNHELPTGSSLLLSDQVQGSIRSSQLEPLVIHFFRLEPARLTGLFTLGEQRFLQRAAGSENLSLRILAPVNAVSERFREVRTAPGGSNLRQRLGLLQLFVEAFGSEFIPEEDQTVRQVDAKERLRLLLRQTSASELAEMSFSDLVQRTNCTPRHVSRVFNEVTGMSFREKQTETRLIRACELLASTHSKIVDVALDSGYQSLSLFNVMFKRRFGLSPGKWRDQMKIRQTVRKRSLAV